MYGTQDKVFGNIGVEEVLWLLLLNGRQKKKIYIYINGKIVDKRVWENYLMKFMMI